MTTRFAKGIDNRQKELHCALPLIPTLTDGKCVRTCQGSLSLLQNAKKDKSGFSTDDAISNVRWIRDQLCLCRVRHFTLWVSSVLNVYANTVKKSFWEIWLMKRKKKNFRLCIYENENSHP